MFYSCPWVTNKTHKSAHLSLLGVVLASIFFFLSGKTNPLSAGFSPPSFFWLCFALSVCSDFLGSVQGDKRSQGIISKSQCLIRIYGSVEGLARVLSYQPYTLQGWLPWSLVSFTHEFVFYLIGLGFLFSETPKTFRNEVWGQGKFDPNQV